MSEPGDEVRAHELARAFQKRWPAEIDDFLRGAGPARREAVVKLCNIDLELRWRRDREGRAEDYFRRYPEEWAASRDEALDLIAAEYELRREHLQLEVYCDDYGDRHDGLIEHMRGRFPQAPPAPPYRDHRYHSSGGLGEVFVAHDVQLGRSVAVKRIRGCYRHDPRSRKQFLFEAEVTGRLEHPGILPVYSLDRGEDGQPEYAMRFIGLERGETLRAAIDRLHDPARSGDGPARSRKLREILGRFVFIGETIAYAHDRGYLHRDIKPDNILLGKFGETWVIDWGLAKFYKTTPVTSPAEGPTPDPAPAKIHDASSSETIAEGTDAYRSPEQAGGKPMGPPSDVYSLGATLYCILTGHDPGRDRGKEAGPAPAPAEFEATPPRRIVPTIPRELEVIVLKAMAHDPGERYPGADALADDVRAYLDGERVAAWREPVTARARRLISKHQTAAVATLAAMALAVVVMGALSYGAYQRKASEVANQLALAKSQDHLINALADISRDDVLETKSHAMDARSVPNVLRAVEELRRAEETASPEVRENRAILALKVADEARKRGSMEDAKKAYRLARDIYTGLVRDFPGNEGAPKNLAACHQNLANLEMETGEPEAARKSLLAGASLLAPIIDDDHSDHEARFKLAKIRLTMAILGKDRHDAAAASREARSGLKLMEDLVRDEPDNLDYLRHQAKGLGTLGNVLGTDGEFSRALEAHKKGLAIRERLVKEDPSSLENQGDLALSLYNIGQLKGQFLDASAERAKGKGTLLAGYKEALDTLLKCWEIREQLHRSRKGDSRVFAQLCQVQGEIGSLLLRSGRTDPRSLTEASRFLGTAIQGYEQLKSEHATSTRFSEPFAACCQNLGVIQLLRKDPDAGFASFARAEDEYKKLLENDPTNRRYRQLAGNQAFSVGNILIALDGSREKARRYLEKARDIQKALVEETPENVAYQRQLKLTMDLLESPR